jgi:hypothetical protein
MKISALILGLLMAVQVLAEPGRIRDVGDGGGGLDRDGQIMTYYSAHIPIGPEALLPAEIPGMGELLQQYSKLALDQDAIAELSMLVYPTDERKYYRVDEKQISPDELQRVIREYTQLMKLPPGDVALFALTNPKTKDTLLLPDFFKLKTPQEQAALLFHESVWLSRSRDKSYNFVVSAEQVAQAFFENPAEPKNYDRFYNVLAAVLGDRTLPLKAYMLYDQKLNVPWSAGTPPKRFLLKNFLSERFLNCFIRNIPPQEIYTETVYRCRNVVRNEMVLLSQKYPQSLFPRGTVNSLRGLTYTVAITTVKPHFTVGDVVHESNYAGTLSDSAYHEYLNHLYVSVPDLASRFNFRLPLEYEDGSPAGSVLF